jgi:two-component system, cell cycle sensor histidine kinase and response regulator CckA
MSAKHLDLAVAQELVDGIDSLPIGLALFDAQNRPLASNQLYRQLLAFIPQLPAPESVSDHEFVVAAADGGARWYCIRDRRTRSGGVIRLLHDITGRKTHQTELRQTQRRFHDTIECIDVGYALFDAQDRLELFNHWYHETFTALADVFKPGIDFERVIRPAGEGAQSVDTGDSPEAWARKRVAAHRQGWGLHEIHLADGRWVALRERRTEDGCTICTVMDITAQKQREDGLQAMVDNIAQAVLVIDAGRRVSASNARALAMFAVARGAERSPRTLEDFVPAAFTHALWQWYEDPAHAETGVFEHQMPAGRVIVARANRLPNGGFVISFNDVTERRQSVDRLHQSQKMEALGLLAGGVAHEFNNLLTAISGFAKLAARKTENPEFVLDCLGEINVAADRAADLTEQMLAFGHKQPLELAVFTAAKVLRGIDRMLRSLLPATIDLAVNIADEEACVWGDAGQMSQVILNLVLNARDAMPDGGRLTIGLETVTPSPDLSASKGMDPHQRYAVFYVADTGTGIEAQVLPHLFEPFFTTKEPGKGTGLGLSVVHSIVERSGGSIAIETVVGKGTKMAIYLPVAAAERDGQPGATPVLRGGNRETILLVEDEPGVRKFADAVLSGLGYRVLAADSAATAMTALAESKLQPDLLLSDIVMPGESGPQLAAALRQSHPDLRIVFITGYADRGVGKQTVLGIDSIVLRKPFSPESLSETIRAAFDDDEKAAAEDRAPLPRSALPVKSGVP